MKPKKCKACAEVFQPARPMQCVCSVKCARALVNANKRADKEARRDRQWWIDKAQEDVNRWVRLRDSDLPCISCGRHHTGVYHAGHYRTTQAAPELRFEPLNIHKQCSACNLKLSGNIINYRINLLLKVGPEMVEWLEGPHPRRKYTIDDLKDIRATYRAKARELERQRE